MREEPQQGPWGDTMHGGPWTRHGHSIPGLTVLAEIRPRNVARCGGVRMCRTCQADAEAARGVTATSAPDLSPAEAVIVARFESAPTLPEVVEARVVEEVARAISDASDAQDPRDWAEYVRDAAAAVAAYRATQDGGAEEAVRRVEALASAPERLARYFHESYERLAPIYGYQTREASAVPWEDVPDANRMLMTAVCAEIGALLRAALAPQAGDCRICGGRNGNHDGASHDAYVADRPAWTFR